MNTLERVSFSRAIKQAEYLVSQTPTETLQSSQSLPAKRLAVFANLLSVSMISALGKDHPTRIRSGSWPRNKGEYLISLDRKCIGDERSEDEEAKLYINTIRIKRDKKYWSFQIETDGLHKLSQVTIKSSQREVILIPKAA